MSSDTGLKEFKEYGTEYFDVPEGGFNSNKITVNIEYPNGTRDISEQITRVPLTNWELVDGKVYLPFDKENNQYYDNRIVENGHIIVTTIDYYYIYDKIYTWEDRYGQSNNVINIDGSGFLRPSYEVERPSELCVSAPLPYLMIYNVDDNNVPKSRIIYQKVMGKPMMCKPSDHLIEYLENQNIEVHDIIKDLPKEMPVVEYEDVDNDDSSTDSSSVDSSNSSNNSESPDKSESTTATSTDESTVSDDSNVVNSEASVQENIPIVDGQGESLPNMTDGNVQLSTPVVQPLSEQPVAVSAVAPQSAPVMQNISTNNLGVQQQNVTVPTNGVTPQIVNVPQPPIAQTMQSPVVQTPPVMTNPQSVSIPTTQVSGIAKLGE